VGQTELSIVMDLSTASGATQNEVGEILGG